MAGPQPISDILSRLISQRGYARVEGIAAEAAIWQQTVGPALASMTRPGEVKRGVWEITVANNIVVQELTFRKAELVTALQTALSQHKLRDLRFKVGTVKKTN